MKLYRNILNGIYKLLVAIVAICLALMIVITFVEVVRRYIFRLSFPWSEELVRYLMVAIGFLGGAAAFKNKGLVVLDLFTSKLPERIKAALDLFNNTAIIVFLVFLLNNSIVSIQAPTIAKQTSIGLKISMAVPFTVIPIGFALMILFALDNYRGLIPGVLGKPAWGEEDKWD